MTTIPLRHAQESELDYLRRKEAAFGLWQADALERIATLEAECAELLEDKRRRVIALNTTRNIINALSDMILKENFDVPIDTFARDYAPFINVMAHHARGGVIESKPKRGRKPE